MITCSKYTVTHKHTHTHTKLYEEIWKLTERFFDIHLQYKICFRGIEIEYFKFDMYFPPHLNWSWSSIGCYFSQMPRHCMYTKVSVYKL